MKTNLLIIDDFYRDPDLIRDVALQSKFEVKGNFPGNRTESFATDDVKEAIQTLILPHAGKITKWDAMYNGSFQYTTAFDRSWIHADNGTTWAGLVYLTPDAPLSSGTGLYKHKETGATEWDPNCGIEYNDYKPNRETQDYTKWELVERYENNNGFTIIKRIGE